MNRIRIVMLAALAALFWTAASSAGEDTLEVWPDGGHIRVLDPRALTSGEAENIYDVLLDRLIAGYSKSGRDYADYSAWQRLNSAPYISDQHGARLVNVYVNDKARAFFTATDTQPLPVGAIVIKDSISAVESGGVSRGPLFVMEKMPAGFAPDFGDWRYSMIMPNGKLFGETGGDGNRAVAFCGECHVQAAELDHLFELPEEYLKK